MTARSLLTAFILAALAAPAPAQIGSNSQILPPFQAVVSTVNESTVRIRCHDKEVALGTVVFPDGYILTKASELHGPASIRLNDGTEYDATIVGVHKETDLAMLHVDATGLKPVTFSDSANAATGSWLIAALPPKTEPIAVGGVGIVSVKTRKLTGDRDAAIFNHNKGFLGILLDERDPKDKDGNVMGAKVVQVNSDGTAKKAGVKVNDIITAVNDFKVMGRSSLQELLDDTRPGETVKLSIFRSSKNEDDETEEIQVKLGSEVIPEALKREHIQNSMGSELSGRRTGFPAVLQTDLVVDAKNCGGPIVDLDGKVLGITIARAGRVETWILPSENIRPLLPDLKSGKLAPTKPVKNDK